MKTLGNNIASRFAKPVFAIVLIFANSFSFAQSTDAPFDSRYFRNPPQVSQATFEVLTKPVPTGNAIVRLEFVDKRNRDPIAIQGGIAPTNLRDDGEYPDNKRGDGVYAAVVNINLQQYYREQQRRTELAKNTKTTPLFSLRELRGVEKFAPTPPRLLQPGDRSPIDRFRGVPITVNASKELLVTATSVIEDPTRTYDVCTGAGTPMGAWTFGKLITEIANEPVTGIRPGDLAEHWLQEWLMSQTINTFTAFARQMRAQLFINSWPRLPDGQLDVSLAPFRLLAIVNRLDLRDNMLYGGTNSGEARLVFTALDCNHVVGVTSIAPDTLDALEFTTIFEYAVPAKTCVGVRGWAQQWHALGGLVLGSAAYNAQLQTITDQFTLRGVNPERSPNQSALNQLRSNEFAFMGSETFWELRESAIIPCRVRCALASGFVENRTVAQTPDGSYRFGAASLLLRGFINNNEGSILAGAHEVPFVLPTGEHMRGAQSQPGAGFAWDPGMVNLEARHQFSKATCSGCHVAETGTHFVHISPRAAGVESELSDFITGNNMPKSDPVSGVSRTFHELLDRAQRLDATAHMSCVNKIDFAVEELFLEPIPRAFVH
jgi:hypothetical protein